jgi:hypothetical protein
MREDENGVDAVLGLAIFGPVVVGAVAVLGGLAGLLVGEMVGAGTMFIAAAIAFGMLALAVYH